MAEKAGHTQQPLKVAGHIIYTGRKQKKMNVVFSLHSIFPFFIQSWTLAQGDSGYHTHTRAERQRQKEIRTSVNLL